MEPMFGLESSEGMGFIAAGYGNSESEVLAQALAPKSTETKSPEEPELECVDSNSQFRYSTETQQSEHPQLRRNSLRATYEPLYASLPKHKKRRMFRYTIIF